MVLPLTVMVALAAPAAAHEERPAGFPDGTGVVPKYLGLDNANHRVVCTTASASRIAAMPAGPLKTRNQQLLGECRYRSIQTAINSIQRRNTSIYVLPGVYDERQWATAARSDYCSHLKTESTSPLDASEYIGSITSPETNAANAESNPIALSYADQRRCAHNLNLIALFGDQTPDERLHPLRQQVLRHPDRGHRPADGRRADRQQVHQAQRHSRRPALEVSTCATSPCSSRSSTPSTCWRPTGS